MTFYEVSVCNVCGGKDILLFCDIPEFPFLLRPLPRTALVRFKDGGMPEAMPLRVGICRTCGHMMLLLKPPDEIFLRLYEDFYGTYLSKLELGFATEDADEFVDLFGKYLRKRLPESARIFEIGCYDGYLLSRLQEFGVEVLGCDPSDGARIGQERGLPIIHAFYSPDTLPSGRFDVVMNRHLIEHIDFPVDFAASFRKILGDSSYIMIETPNGAYHLHHGLLDPFHFEHLSVFTPASLAVCLRKAGFQIEQMFSDSRNLIAVCKAGGEAEQTTMRTSEVEILVAQAVLFGSRFKEYLSRLDSLIEEITAQGATIGVWGVGSFGISIFALSKTLREAVVAVVDRDPRKHGLSFFNVDLEIRPPEYLIHNPVDYVVVCSQYGAEIMRDIREHYNLDSALVLMSPTIEVIR
jgi:2-polyprenyl-3-methyl-5-hydroxy-6-metoxy-1,4-benzoquinol methylase